MANLTNLAILATFLANLATLANAPRMVILAILANNTPFAFKYFRLFHLYIRIKAERYGSQ